MTVLFGGKDDRLLFVTSVSAALVLSRKYGSWLDRISAAMASLSSAPSWIFGIILILVLAGELMILPFPKVIDLQYAEMTPRFIRLLLTQMVMPVLAIFFSIFFQGVYAWRTFFLIYSQEDYVDMARADGDVLVGGNILADGEYAKGYFVEPAIIEGLPEDHELVKNELFLPILYVTKVKTLDEAMEKANNTVYGLTAGFFGEEVDWFFENIQSGTTYVNRAAGATTGAWPGVQVFGGWKGSGSSGKGIGGLYTLALYMHEQSRTIIG